MENKKTKSLIFILFAFVLLISTTLFSACACSDLLRKTLQAPIININDSKQEVIWNAVDGAESYSIYINNNLVTNIKNNNSNNSYSYSFSEYLQEKNTNDCYVFNVVAESSQSNKSVQSNNQVYLYGSQLSEESSFNLNNSSQPVKNVYTDAVSSKKIYWNKVTGASEYYVLIYDNENGEKVIKTNINGFDFSSYIVKNQILALRVGVKNDKNEICFSDAVFYNDALYSGDYGDDATTLNKLFNTIYLFKGNYFDCYLTGQEEMNQMMYYMFVNRIEDQELAISKSYYTSLVNKYGRTNYIYLIGNNYKLGGIGEGTNSFTETCDYTLDFDYDTVLPSRHFYVGFKFRFIKGSNNEPTLVQSKELVQSDLDVGYYQKVDYEKRASNYNNFVSDKYALTQYVTSSEQLYFAVEHKITPLFKDTNSSAYKLYNKAKQVLREIISDEMTDYEKALSIFDWICLNSVYDNKIVNYTSSTVSFTNYTSFSLEGVLFDGLAVCDGYSKTYSLLCNMEGIDCVRITGAIDRNGDGISEGLHAWNKVKVNNNWYVVDITWSVIDTGANDFYQDGATKYNSNEFLNHMYFLVSDDDIFDHIASDTELNTKCASPNSYNYYDVETYNGTNNLVIKNQEQLDTLIAWMLENKIYSIDVVFDKASVLDIPKLFDNMIKITKTHNGIEAANIMSLGAQSYMYYNDDYRGVVFNLTLINLHKVNAA